jgi:hypothetical protein
MRSIVSVNLDVLECAGDIGVLRTLIQFFPCAFRCETDQGHHEREKKKLKIRSRRMFRDGARADYKYARFLSIRFTFS